MVSFMCDSVCACVWVDVVGADQPVVFSTRLLLAVTPKAKVSLSLSLPLCFHLSISNHMLLLSEPLTLFNICQKASTANEQDVNITPLMMQCTHSAVFV